MAHKTRTYKHHGTAKRFATWPQPVFVGDTDLIRWASGYDLCAGAETVKTYNYQSCTIVRTMTVFRLGTGDYAICISDTDVPIVADRIFETLESALTCADRWVGMMDASRKWVRID